MKVFKFGGASVENTTCIQNVANIIQSFAGQDLVIIISAMGKTTNALEKVATAFFNKQKIMIETMINKTYRAYLQNFLKCKFHRNYGHNYI